MSKSLRLAAEQLEKIAFGREPKVSFAKAPKAAKVRRGTLQPSVAAPPLCEL